MKTSYFVSRLLRPVFAAATTLAIATTVLSASVSYADDAVEITDSEGACDTPTNLVDDSTATGSYYYAEAFVVKGTLGSLNANVTATQTGSSAYYGYGIDGVCVWGGTGAIASIGTITDTVTIDISSTNGAVYAVDVYYGSITNLNGKVIATSTNSSAIGVGVWDSSSIGSITGDITVSAGTSAYGVYNDGGTIGAISGDIEATATGSLNAYGICNCSSITGDISGDITVKATTLGSASGIISYSGSSTGNVTGDIDVSINSGSDIATGIQINSGATIGTIDSQITVSAVSDDDSKTSSIAYGIKSENGKTITLAEGTSITVTGADSNYSLYSLSGDLTLASTASLTGNTSTVITLTGDISARSGAGTTTFASGDYIVNDCTFYTDIAITEAATLTVSGDTNLNGQTISFYLTDDYDGSALFSIAADADMYTNTTMSSIYIYMDADMWSSYTAGESSLNLIDIYNEDALASFYYADVETENYGTVEGKESIIYVYTTADDGVNYTLVNDDISFLDISTTYDAIDVATDTSGTTITINDGTIAASDPFYVLEIADLSGTLGDVTINISGGDFILPDEDGAATYYNRSGVFVGSTSDAITIDKLVINFDNSGSADPSQMASLIAGTMTSGSTTDAFVVTDGRYVDITGGQINGAVVSGSVSRGSSTYSTTGGSHTYISGGAIIGDGVTYTNLLEYPGNVNGVYYGSVYGADAIANSSIATVDYTEVVISDATISGFVVAGGLTYAGPNSLTITGATGVRDGVDSDVTVATQITINDGANIMGGYVIGGNLAINQAQSKNAIYGNTYVDINGGTIQNAAGEGYVYGSTFVLSVYEGYDTSKTTIEHTGDTFVNVTGGTNSNLQVYGGGGMAQGDYDPEGSADSVDFTLYGNTNVTISNTSVGDVYGGTSVETCCAVEGDDNTVITFEATITGNTTINLIDATITGSVYGGGSFESYYQDAGESFSTVLGNSTINISGDTTVAGIISGQGKGGATVEGTSTLNFTGYKNADAEFTVQDFDIINVGVDSSVTLTGSSDLSASSVFIDSAATLTFDVDEDSSLIVGGDITSIADTASLVKSGDGSMSVEGSMVDYEGSLTVSSGELLLSSALDASSVTIASGATLSMTVSGDDTFSNADLAFNNGGTLVLTAGTSLEAGGHDVFEASVSDIGTVTTYGGTLTGNVFTLKSADTLYINESGGAKKITESSRLTVTFNDDSSAPANVLMDFSIVGGDASPTSITVNSVSTTTGVDQSTLITSLDLYAATIDTSVAYSFSVDDLGTGDTVYLSFYVGTGYDDCDIAIFHQDSTTGGWVVDDSVSNITYDGQYVSFVVTHFSDWNAVMYSAIPEPSTATLSLLALAGLCVRRRRKA